jgi:hypothetical protein
MTYDKSEKRFKESAFKRGVMIVLIKSEQAYIYFNNVNRDWFNVVFRAEDKPILFKIDQEKKQFVFFYKDVLQLRINGLKAMKASAEATVTKNANDPSSTLTAARTRLDKLNAALQYYELKIRSVLSNDDSVAKMLDGLERKMEKVTAETARSYLPKLAPYAADPYDKTFSIPFAKVKEIITVADAEIKVTFINLREQPSESGLKATVVSMPDAEFRSLLANPSKHAPPSSQTSGEESPVIMQLEENEASEE